MTKIIADISGNHGGSRHKALDLICAAADCGCDYAKFQYYKPSKMPDYAENAKTYDKLQVPAIWVDDLFATAAHARIPLFASVFDMVGAKFIQQYNPPFVKIASPESTRLQNYPELVGEVRRGMRIIFSSGWKDYKLIAPLMGEDDLLLYCPPCHPALPNVWVPPEFDGLSDHCADLTNAARAIEDGFEWIERHIKLDEDCIDARFSSNPREMTELCKLAKAS